MFLLPYLPLLAVVGALGLILSVRALRRGELGHMASALDERRRLSAAGAAEAQLAHPVIDLSRCLGCGTCVAVCPEEGVLSLVHGQAAVVRGSACRGISACERECPVGAVTVTLANLEQREDVPRLAAIGASSNQLAVPGRPGLFLAGEVTAHGLIRRAMEHGIEVAEAVAARAERPAGSRVRAGRQLEGSHATGSSGGAREPAPSVVELVIVGAGPAGLACALAAREAGVDLRLFDQASSLGGAVARYPRRKLVLTEPVRLPGFGRLGARSYVKEELVELWHDLGARAKLELEGGRTLVAIEGVEASGAELPAAPLPRTGPADPPRYRLTFEHGSGEREVIEAANVCLALGRGGTPRRLGVPGEDLPKVSYSLQDAGAFTDRRVLVVGGGEAAVEAALALAEVSTARVTLVHRRSAFPRIAPSKERALTAAVADGRLRLCLETEVASIEPGFVRLEDATGAGFHLPNDDVLALVGGRPPFELLRGAGVRFEPEPGPALRASAAAPGPSTGARPTLKLLTRAVLVASFLAVPAFLWVQRDYYGLATDDRPLHALHDLLRPGAGLGLGAGLLGLGLVLVNLAYLARRLAPPGLRLGSLTSWMRSHIFTGLMAPLIVLLHAGLAPRQTVGGHALWALCVLVVTGAIGRYFYAFLPRAANGRELALGEVKDLLGEEAQGATDGARRELATEAMELVRERQWGGSLAARFAAVVGVRRDLRRFEARVRARCGDEAEDLVVLARLAYRRALLVAHLEDLRGLVSAWRYLHRWVAFLMVVLTVLHVVHATAFGAVLGELSGWFGGLR
ncbi:MAG: NAD(P)-binding domain-containing protein [Planctomycetota bacterium]|nr:NAD(P)-binding domain-containing protein [Planctomycetota bacterium]